jgi:hypothetical protein
VQSNRGYVKLIFPFFIYLFITPTAKQLLFFLIKSKKHLFYFYISPTAKQLLFLFWGAELEKSKQTKAVAEQGLLCSSYCFFLLPKAAPLSFFLII